jgi:hypothetical protein
LGTRYRGAPALCAAILNSRQGAGGVFRRFCQFMSCGRARQCQSGCRWAQTWCSLPRTDNGGARSQGKGKRTALHGLATVPQRS